MKKEPTFEVGNFRAQSFVCALALSFAAFSILPFSIAAVRDTNRAEEPLLVYSMGDVNSVSARSASSAAAYSPSVPSGESSGAHNLSPNIEIDVSKAGTGNFGISAGGGKFGIEGFGRSLGEGGAPSAEISAFELSELDKIPRRLNSVHVRYPKSLLDRGEEGDVRLIVIIDEDGNTEVESVEKSSNELFTTAAVEAARKLKYETPTKNGEPVRARFVLPMPFRIQR